jgi:hypothetical protein
MRGNILRVPLSSKAGEGPEIQFDESQVEPDLRGHFRFGVTKEEIEPYPDKLKQLFSFASASQREKNQFRIQQAIEAWKRKEGDTGSPEVQGFDRFQSILNRL